MKLVEGRQLVYEILQILRPICECIEVAGSIRRKKPEVRDIDLVLIPKPLVDVVNVLERSMGAEVVKRGQRVANLKIRGVGVDLNFCNQAEFAPMLLFRTGSWQFNTRLASKAKRLGLKFSPHGVFKGGKRIDENTEDSIFEMLKEEYVKPEER